MASHITNRDPDERPLRALTTTPPTTREEHAAQMRLRVERRRAIEDALEVSRHALGGWDGR